MVFTVIESELDEQEDQHYGIRYAGCYSSREHARAVADDLAKQRNVDPAYFQVFDYAELGRGDDDGHWKTLLGRAAIILAIGLGLAVVAAAIGLGEALSVHH